MTMTLIAFAYYTRFVALAPIMLLMDFTDVFLAWFKMVVDVFDRIQVVAYVLLVLTWFFYRIWFFPQYMLAQVWTQGQASSHKM